MFYGNEDSHVKAIKSKLQQAVKLLSAARQPAFKTAKKFQHEIIHFNDILMFSRGNNIHANQLQLK